MVIKTLNLENFRNYKEQNFSFKEELNIISGKNGAGKTNILESVFILSLFKSPRTTKEKELINFDAEKSRIKAFVEKKIGAGSIDIQIDSLGKKRAFIKGIPIKRAAELVGVLGTVFFSPDEMKLVKETPSERRRFLDIGLSQQQREYFLSLSNYNKVLKQKNSFLKTNYNDSNINEMLYIWDMQLAEYGSIIITRRNNYINLLSDEAAVIHSELSDKSENLLLSYEGATTAVKQEEIKEELLEELNKNREKDKKLGYCSIGPHRDDILISVNNLDGRKFASQGQQRTIALAMKLAEAEMFKKEKGEYPVLLLDDVLSELDKKRQEKLLKLTKKMQTLLTCTNFELPIEANHIKIENGKIN